MIYIWSTLQEIQESRSAPSEAQQAARQSVIREAGDQRRGEHLADLIERSASTKDDTDLRLIGTYNQTQPHLSEKKPLN